jgi:primosomal protein N' (replication factor Y)
MSNLISNAQEVAFDEIKESHSKRSLSLHGVTSRENRFIKLIEELLPRKASSIFITRNALRITACKEGWLRAYFGNKVAVFHSKYNNNERVEVF